MMQLFSKPLTSTDIRKRLAIPTKTLTTLLHNRGGNAVELRVRHGTAVWPIMCTTRRKGYEKPVLSKGWRSFALKNKLNVGDIVTLFKEADEAGYLNYRIGVERADSPSLKHSGATVKNSPNCKYEDGEVKQFAVTVKLFGVRVVETGLPVKHSDESAAGRADTGAKSSEGLNLDLTLAPPIVNGPRKLLWPILIAQSKTFITFRIFASHGQVHGGQV